MSGNPIMCVECGVTYHHRHPPTHCDRARKEPEIMSGLLEIWARCTLAAMDRVPDETWLRHFPEDRPSPSQRRRTGGPADYVDLPNGERIHSNTRR